MATESVSIIIKAFDQTQKALRGIKRAFAGLSKIFFNFKTVIQINNSHSKKINSD